MELSSRIRNAIGDGVFKNRKRRSHGNVVPHQIVDHGLNLRAGNIKVFRHLGLRRPDGGTYIALLPGVKLRIHEQAVLQVVDAHIRGLAKAYGAKMPGDFQSVRVSGIDRGLQLLRRDEHVSLEGGDAFSSPVIHGIGCVAAPER